MSKAPLKFRDYPKSLYTPAQAEWCRMYQRETLFEPVMENYELNKETFKQAQSWNIEWFKSWAAETYAKLKEKK